MSEKPSSPCNLVCTIDPKTSVCFGCGRTRDEIALWGSMSEETRLKIMDGLPDRLKGVERPARRETKRQRMARKKQN